MFSFIISILILIAGYFVYGAYIERKFAADDAIPTPVMTKADGVDFVELPTWRIFMIQLLNIAGLGPIFGAILGAKYGTAAYLWIVFGCIFFGATHDYFSGMMSIRNGGESISEITGRYLGTAFKHFTRIVSFFLLILVGASFINGPAGLLATLTNGAVPAAVWVGIIIVYYILATLLPIDQIIGRIYPFFGAALLLMAVGVGGYMVVFQNTQMVELGANTFQTFQLNPTENILYPMLFIILSCGAISGFHSTQSPIMARCTRKESDGRKIFFGAMIAEGVLTLIWANAAINYFGGAGELNRQMAVPNHNPAWLVHEICTSWLGSFGAIIAIIGVVACPITTGDTAFRSARLLAADILKVDQKLLLKRTLISLPLFVVGFGLSQIEFSLIWKFVGMTNQMLAGLVLWTSASYMVHHNKPHWVLSIPAVLITVVVITYFFVAPHSQGGLALDVTFGYVCGIAGGLMAMGIFLRFAANLRKGIHATATTPANELLTAVE